MEKILFLGGTVVEWGRNFAVGNWRIAVRALAVFVVGWLWARKKVAAKKALQKFVEKFDFWIFELWRDHPERVAALPELGLKSQLAAGRENIFEIFGEISAVVQRGFSQGKLSSDLELPAMKKFAEAARRAEKNQKILGGVLVVVVVAGGIFGLWWFG